MTLLAKPDCVVATIMSIYVKDDPIALARAINSVLDQRFTDSVISRLYVAVDGPVTPALNEVLSGFEGRIHKLCRLKQNGGLAAALNHLVKSLDDESFVFRMDADDYSYPERYQRQLTYFRERPDIDILGTDIIEVDVESGRRRYSSFCRGPEDGVRNLYWRVPVAHPTVCFRRHVLDKVGGYPLAGTNEDIALWISCVKAGFRFDNIREPLLDFSIGPGFWKRRGFKKAYSELKCYWGGVYSMYGFSWRYIVPFLRFLFRLAPQKLVRVAYGSGVRRKA